MPISLHSIHLHGSKRCRTSDIGTSTRFVLIGLFFAYSFIICMNLDKIQEISMCSMQYRMNLCEMSPIPAMMQQCASWETCMNRDPSIVGRAKVGAELIAEVINGFVDQISWRTLVCYWIYAAYTAHLIHSLPVLTQLFALTTLAILTVFINALLSLYRSQHHPIANPPRQSTPNISPIPAVPLPPNRGNNWPTLTYSWRQYRSEQSNQAPAPRRRRLEGGTAASIRWYTDSISSIHQYSMAFWSVRPGHYSLTNIFR